MSFVSCDLRLFVNAIVVVIVTIAPIGVRRFHQFDHRGIQSLPPLFSDKIFPFI